LELNPILIGKRKANFEENTFSIKKSRLELEDKKAIRAQFLHIIRFNK
jgi:hypothetical protein